MYWLHQDENCRKTHCGKGKLDAFCPEHVAHHQARVSGALVPVHPVSKIRVWYDKNKTADKRGIPGQTLTDSCSTQLGRKIGQVLTRSIQDLIADNTSCVLQPPEQPHVVFNAKSGTLG